MGTEKLKRNTILVIGTCAGLVSGALGILEYEKYNNLEDCHKKQICYIEKAESPETKNDHDLLYLTKNVNIEDQPIKKIKEKVYITLTGKCYHQDADCSHSGDTIEVDKEEAIKVGYKPCYYCCH